MDVEKTPVTFVIEFADKVAYEQRKQIEDFIASIGIEVKDTYYRPHSKFLPLPEYNAPSGCNLSGHVGVCYFEENGRWIPYWREGRYYTVEQVEWYRRD